MSAQQNETGMRIETDILIVGGGLVGLTLGRALALKGIRSVAVDREPAESQTDAAYDGRGSAIALGSKQLLDRIGLWDRIVPEAGPILDIRVSDGDSRLFLHYDHREVGDQPMGWIVENTVTRRALFDGLAEVPGLTLLAPMNVATLERRQDGVAATLADGRIVFARLAIAADGRGSRLREEAGIKVTRWSYGQTGIVCSVSMERPHRNIAHERFLPAGPFALLPMTGIPGHPNRASIVWTERDDLVPQMLALDDDAFSAEMNRRFGDYCGRLTLLGRRWHYPLSLLLAERMTDRRLALVGDAAHGIHPIAGQGLNLGLRDVEVLVELLAEAHGLGLDLGSAALLADYDRRRRVDTMTLVAATDGLNRLFSNDIAPVRLARRLGLAAVNQMPPLKRLFMRHAMGTIGG
jgi:2-octaprenyl-6-methoxyphenol hydroxylase